jgi:hypothetical protein
MLPYVLSQIQALMQTARDSYGVNPIIFLVLYIGSAPFWYYSLFRTLRALGLRRMNEVMLWSAVFLCATVTPFVYVIFFGRNIPWWIYALIAVLIGQGVVSLIMKLRRPLGTTPQRPG